MSFESAVLRFIYDQIRPDGFCFDQFSDDLDLRQDLGIDGDDAVEFLELFCEQYGVDASNFEFEDYFFTEAELTSNILSRVVNAVVAMVTGRGSSASRALGTPTKLLRVADLIESVRVQSLQ